MDIGPHLIFRTPIKVRAAEMFSSLPQRSYLIFTQSKALLQSEKVFTMYKWKKTKAFCTQAGLHVNFFTLSLLHSMKSLTSLNYSKLSVGSKPIICR